MKISFLIQNFDRKNIHFSLEIDDDATILQLKELLEATEYGDKSFNLELIFGDLNVKMSDSVPFKFYHPDYYTGNHAITLPNYEQSSLMNKRAGRQLVEVDNQMSLLSKKISELRKSMQNSLYETFGSEEYKHLSFSCVQHIENAVKNISDAIFQLSRQQSLLIEEAYGTKHPLHNCAVTVAQYTQYLLNKPK